MKKCGGVVIVFEKEIPEDEAEDFMEKLTWLKGVFKVKKATARLLTDDDWYSKADIKYTRLRYKLIKELQDALEKREL